MDNITGRWKETSTTVYDVLTVFRDEICSVEISYFLVQMNAIFTKGHRINLLHFHAEFGIFWKKNFLCNIFDLLNDELLFNKNNLKCTRIFFKTRVIVLFFTIKVLFISFVLFSYPGYLGPPTQQLFKISCKSMFVSLYVCCPYYLLCDLVRFSAILFHYLNFVFDLLELI